jgi:glycosyltransferase involved in cell wall biosynthesis
VVIVMAHGRADPKHDGVADYVYRLSAALRDLGVEVEAVPVGRGAAGVLHAARRVRALRPHVVHVQFAPSAFGFSPWPGLLPDLVRAPVVVTLHEYGWWSAPPWIPEVVWRTIERRCRFDRETWRLAPTATAVVTTNSGHAEVLARRLGLNAVHIALAANVPDCGNREPREVVRRRLKVPVNAEVVAFFGFVHPVKGLRYLIEALAKLRSGDHRRESLHLLVLGGFTSLALPEPEAMAFRAELVGWTRTCGMAGHVTITDHLPAEQISAALHASDLAAFPFTAGATMKSGALLTALAHRLPTAITTADPPDPELGDGQTVVAASRVRDAEALAEVLDRLLDDPALRARVAAGGAALVADRSWPRIAEAHRALYGQVLAGENPCRPSPGRGYV